LCLVLSREGFTRDAYLGNDWRADIPCRISVGNCHMEPGTWHTQTGRTRRATVE